MKNIVQKVENLCQLIFKSKDKKLIVEKLICLTDVLKQAKEKNISLIDSDINNIQKEFKKIIQSIQDNNILQNYYIFVVNNKLNGDNIHINKEVVDNMKISDLNKSSIFAFLLHCAEFINKLSKTTN